MNVKKIFKKVRTSLVPLLAGISGDALFFLNRNLIRWGRCIKRKADPMCRVSQLLSLQYLA